MICYKDKCWCSESEALKGCKNFECFRNYTKKEDAINQQHYNLPLSLATLKNEDCGYVK